MVEKEYIYFS